MEYIEKNAAKEPRTSSVFKPEEPKMMPEPKMPKALLYPYFPIES